MPQMLASLLFKSCVFVPVHLIGMREPLQFFPRLVLFPPTAVLSEPLTERLKNVLVNSFRFIIG